MAGTESAAVTRGATHPNLPFTTKLELSARVWRRRILKRLGHPPRPVIIYQMGKVGSLTVLHSLEKYCQDRPLHHCHMLVELEAEERRMQEELCDPSGPLGHVQNAKLLRAQMQADPNQAWDIITLVREPISRNISGFFQNLEAYVPEIAAGQSPDEIQPGLLLERFLGMGASFDPTEWFKAQFEPLVEFDIFSTPFPQEQGYATYRPPKHRVLLLRLEDLNRIGCQAIARFLDIPLFPLLETNRGGAKTYSDAYNRFRREIKLPESVISTLLATKYARHFYSPAELEALKRKWTQ